MYCHIWNINITFLVHNENMLHKKQSKLYILIFLALPLYFHSFAHYFHPCSVFFLRTILSISNIWVLSIKSCPSSELVIASKCHWSTSQSRVPLQNPTVTHSKIPCHSLNLQVQHQVHKSLPMYAILCHMNPDNILLSYFSKNHFDIILPSLTFLQVFLPRFYVHLS